MNNLTAVDVDVAMLPLQLRQLVNLISFEETLKLLQARGGTRMRMPVRAELATQLPQLISREAVQKICDSDLAGQRIDLPKIDKVLLQVRNASIKAAKGKTTARELAQRYGLTTRMIKLIWNGDAEDDPTPDMFS